MIRFIDAIFTLYTFMIFVRILGSWIPEWSDTKFMRFIGYYVDPYLNFFRRFVPALGMLDFSPLVALITLQVLESIIVNLLTR